MWTSIALCGAIVILILLLISIITSSGDSNKTNQDELQSKFINHLTNTCPSRIYIEKDYVPELDKNAMLSLKKFTDKFYEKI